MAPAAADAPPSEEKSGGETGMLVFLLGVLGILLLTEL